MTPENRFIGNVHRYLKNLVYFEKMHNEYRGGTPDVYYEGVFMFWAEYKYIKKVPKRRFTPNLSELQKRWLKRNFDAGHNPIVIVGFPRFGVILETPDMWERQVSMSEVVLRTYGEIAIEIDKKANNGNTGRRYNAHS